MCHMSSESGKGEEAVDPRRENVSSGTLWEAVVGYSRAVRVGRFVYVSGTTATNEKDDVVGAGDPYAQTTGIEERRGGAASGGGKAFGRGMDQDLRDEHRRLG